MHHSAKCPIRERIPRPKVFAFLIIGSLIGAFGISNIHAYAHVTEGGVLGATLLIHHWTGISPAVSSILLNGVCFMVGWRSLGRSFLIHTVIACASYALFEALFEPVAPLVPFLIQSPIVAAIAGACCIGIGTGLTVRAGGAMSGDDALAMTFSHRTRLGPQWCYFISDLSVLALSLSYIPLAEIAWSLLSVMLSTAIIALMQRIRMEGE